MIREDVTISIGVGEQVSGVLHLPSHDRSDWGIVLAHGAGNDMNQPMLAFLAEGLAAAGHVTLRFNFLYKERGGNVPDKPEVLSRVWLGAHRFLASHPKYRPEKIVAAGKSLGGRMASHLVAEKRLAVERLVFLGYPLHPLGKKDRLRDGHLYEIAIPMLFVAGSRDQLCDLELLRSVLNRLKAPWTLAVIEGGDHSFNLPKSAASSSVDVHGRILDHVLRWLSA